MKISSHSKWTAIIAFVFILSSAAIVTHASQQKKSSGEVQVIEIELGDYYYKPDTLHIKTGQPVLLKFKNAGTIEHEFMAGRKIGKDFSGFAEDLFVGVKVEIKPEEMMSMQHSETKEGEKQEHQEEMSHKHDMEHNETAHDDHHDTMISLQPKQTAAMTFTLPQSKKGVWQMGCFLELGPKTHYDFGMKGVLLVK